MSSTSSDRLTARLDAWIFQSHYVTLRGQAIFRMFLALYLLLFFTPGINDYRLSPLADLPQSLFAPPLGPMMLANGLPSATTLQVVDFALTLSLVCVLLGWYTRPATALAALSILLLEGFGNSLGKVSHGGVLTGYVMLVMAFSSWGKAYSFDAMSALRRGEAPPRQDETSWVGPMVALITGLMFLSAGLAKAHAGWLSPGTHATEHIADVFLFRGDGGVLTEWLLNLDLPFLWEIGDYSTIIFECGLVVAALRLAVLRAFLVFAVAFHVMNYLVLNIPFATIIGAYALFLPWDALIETEAFAATSQTAARMVEPFSHPVAPVLIALPVTIALQAFGSPVLQPLEWVVPGRDGVQQAVVYSVCAGVVALCVWLWLKSRLVSPAASLDPQPLISGDTGGV